MRIGLLVQTQKREMERGNTMALLVLLLYSSHGLTEIVAHKVWKASIFFETSSDQECCVHSL